MTSPSFAQTPMCKATDVDLPNRSSDPLTDQTRARLFATLGELRRAAPTDELARLLDLHVNGVRRQLERLEGSGLIDRRQVVRGRGRPRDEWSVSASAEPASKPATSYEELAQWLARSIAPSRARLREVERAGREIGREIAPEPSGDLEQSFGEALSALGFNPSIEAGEEGLLCTLGNCPYRAPVQVNQELVCTLHRGLTAGLLDGLAPGAKLTRFEPHDPERAGCVVSVAAGGD